jgi:hypothetical protein
VKEIGNVQMGVLGTDAEVDDIFDELNDRLTKDLGISTKTTAWNRTIRDFKEQLPAMMVTAQAAAAAQSLLAQDDGSIASSSADEITIRNASVIGTAHGKELHAEATNNDAVQHSATVKATFYGADGGIVGTADGIVNQLRPGGTKTISLDGIPDYARFKVEVDTLF